MYPTAYCALAWHPHIPQLKKKRAATRLTLGCATDRDGADPFSIWKGTPMKTISKYLSELQVLAFLSLNGGDVELHWVSISCKTFQSLMRLHERNIIVCKYYEKILEGDPYGYSCIHIKWGKFKPENLTNAKTTK